jgi:NAD(P)-dependent dehydrogenase (short-subunit alcohol dehydrogenase family)
MSPRLTDRIAIVTGSSSELDRARGLAYAEEGAIVVCADIQPMTVKDSRGEFPVTTHELIVQRGGKSSSIKTDVREELQIKSLVA